MSRPQQGKSTRVAPSRPKSGQPPAGASINPEGVFTPLKAPAEDRKSDPEKQPPANVEYPSARGSAHHKCGDEKSHLPGAIREICGRDSLRGRENIQNSAFYLDDFSGLFRAIPALGTPQLRYSRKAAFQARTHPFTPPGRRYSYRSQQYE